MKTKMKSLVCAILLSAPVLAQDVIIFKNGNELKVKVKEITPTSVMYLNYENLQGPTYTESRSSIFMVKYENGYKDVFSDPVPETITAIEQFTPTVPINALGNNDLIITKGGQSVECKIDRVTGTTIYYHVLKHGPDILSSFDLLDIVSYTKNNQTQPVIIPPSKKEILEEDQIIEVRKYGGPRVGITVAGDGALSQALDAEGKRNYFSQFGWQFEQRVFTLKNGLSGMFEFVPMVGGLDMGKFIPSASVLIGLRTKEGFEFGAGPNLAFFHGKDMTGGESTSANLGVVIASGFSLKSGKVYFPINIAFVPSITKQSSAYDTATRQTITREYQTGMKFTLTVGFNSRKQ